MQSKLQQAIGLHRSGHLAGAKVIYEEILKVQPDHSDSLHLLGIIALQTGNPRFAVTLLDRAIMGNQGNPAFYSNRGHALRELKQLEAAVASCDQAIALKPDYAEAHSNRGNALYELRRLEAAVASYNQAIVLRSDYAEAYSNRGNALRELGQWQMAVASFDQAIAIRPNFADAYSNRGNALYELGQLEAAVASYDQAVKLRPAYAEAYSNRGSALRGLKQLDAAVASCDQAIAIRPDYAEAYSNRGNALYDLRHVKAAVASYDQAIVLRPDFAEAYSNRGNALYELRHLEAAVASYDQAIGLRPDYAEAYSNRGHALCELGHLEAAVASCDQAIALAPDYAEAYSNRGNALKELRQHKAAVASYDRAIALKPDFAEAYSNRGSVFTCLMRPDEAIASCDRAIALRPDLAEAFVNRGNALHEVLRLDAAVASYDRARALNPACTDAQWNKSLVLLLGGNYEQGWPLYEWRWKVKGIGLEPRQYAQPLWLGVEPLNGKTILLHNEQGIGDALQLCRYAILVADLGARVIVEVAEPLKAVLRGLSGVSEIIAPGATLPAFDYHCPLLSLPLAFKTTLASIPCAGGYLRADPAKVAHWARKLGKKTRPRVGLAWSGRAEQKNDHNRSLALAALVPQLSTDLEYISLQKDVRDSDRDALRGCAIIRHFGSDLADFSDTAALCELVDVVVCVDTSVAHLSGALGKQTWVMLCYCPDWRWLLARDDNPWYSSARLYRQHAPTDWTRVLARIKTDLATLAG